MITPEPLHCSFCGKSQKEVSKLIAGTQVYICDECIELCNGIIAEAKEKNMQEKFVEVVATISDIPIWTVEVGRDSGGNGKWMYCISEAVAAACKAGQSGPGATPMGVPRTQRIVTLADGRQYSLGPAIKIHTEDPRKLAAEARAKLTPEELDALLLTK